MKRLQFILFYFYQLQNIVFFLLLSPNATLQPPPHKHVYHLAYTIHKYLSLCMGCVKVNGRIGVMQPLSPIICLKARCVQTHSYECVCARLERRKSCACDMCMRVRLSRSLLNFSQYNNVRRRTVCTTENNRIHSHSKYKYFYRKNLKCFSLLSII